MRVLIMELSVVVFLMFLISLAVLRLAGSRLEKDPVEDRLSDEVRDPMPPMKQVEL